MDKYHIKTISRFMERAEEIGDELYNYYKAFDFFVYKNVDNMIQQLDNIQTNYVTVTKSDVKIFENGYIPRPHELYHEYVG